MSTSWLTSISLIAVCGGALSMSACQSQPAPSPPAGGAFDPIRVQIDFNGRRHNKQLQVDFKPELTPFECLQKLQGEGKLSLASRGNGGQTLVTAIDGLENEWATGDNWVFTVNERLGDRSSGVFALQPGDRLVWRFGKYQPE